MKNTYEDCIDFIENKLGLQLFDCQKELIRISYENPNLYIAYPRHYGGHIMTEHLKLFFELMFKENK